VPFHSTPQFVDEFLGPLLTFAQSGDIRILIVSCLNPKIINVIDQIDLKILHILQY